MWVSNQRDTRGLISCTYCSKSNWHCKKRQEVPIEQWREVVGLGMLSYTVERLFTEDALRGFRIV